ncbi:hypothetical protein EIN_486540 [Entamoeba invadens IP1]|uniref:Protein serine/threonine kinase n=1 Tax=Entamoeba invadens IP1 TaxID=370355 RepID=A0A0A1U4M7_ENTIV|nr:hypothetical protein EIN_486540 [Entamoeba invadens IP1]ELP89212.1 hypothetical protein EIN_486540 [Entamoeba invadens IP1]|eukprot:XP_004255983.1 hypothetical protein EIN_486540 [Entamoeba invadens IP1]
MEYRNEVHEQSINCSSNTWYLLDSTLKINPYVNIDIINFKTERSSLICKPNSNLIVTGIFYSLGNSSKNNLIFETGPRFSFNDLTLVFMTLILNDMSTAIGYSFSFTGTCKGTLEGSSIFNMDVLKIEQASNLKTYNSSSIQCKNILINETSTISFFNDSLLSSNKIMTNFGATMNMYNNSTIECDLLNCTNGSNVNLINNAIIHTNSIDINNGTSLCLYNETFLDINNSLTLINSRLDFRDGSRIHSDSIYLRPTNFALFSEKTLAMMVSNFLSFQLSFTYVLTVEKSPYIKTNFLILDFLGGIINVINRERFDMPLFVTKNSTIQNLNEISIADSIEQFDFIYSDEQIKNDFITPKCKILKGQLIRCGSNIDNTLFCHIIGMSNNNNNYIESYCNEFIEDYYLVPINDVHMIVVRSELSKGVVRHEKSNKKELNTQTLYVTFGETTVILDKVTDFIHINVTSQIPIDITTNILSQLSNQKQIFVTFSSSKGVLFERYLCSNGFIITSKIICILNATCENGIFDSTKGKCQKCQDTSCAKCTYDNQIEICQKCDSPYDLYDNICMKHSICKLSDGNTCIVCNDGYIIKNKVCVKLDGKCQIERNGLCELCDPIFSSLISISGECKIVENVIQHSAQSVIECNKGYMSNSSYCNKCDLIQEECDICDLMFCTKCLSSFVISQNTKCVTSSCNIANNNFKDQNGNCFPDITNCEIVVNGKCVKCIDNCILENDTCITNYNNTFCAVGTSWGCTRCINGFYYSYNTKTCEQCNSNCQTCLSQSICLSCNEGMFLSDHVCKSNDELKESYKKFSNTGSGCYQCNDGYYRNGIDCKHCDISCDTCLRSSDCFTCNLTNFKDFEGNCKPQTDLIGCAVQVTQNGCSICKPGYYSTNNECGICSNNCKECTLYNKLNAKYILKLTLAILEWIPSVQNVHFGRSQMKVVPSVKTHQFGG